MKNLTPESETRVLPSSFNTHKEFAEVWAECSKYTRNIIKLYLHLVSMLQKHAHQYIKKKPFTYVVFLLLRFALVAFCFSHCLPLPFVCRFLRLQELGDQIWAVQIVLWLPRVVLTAAQVHTESHLVSPRVCAKGREAGHGATHSEKPFHLSRYSTLPFTTRRFRTFSTTYSSSSSSSSGTSSGFFSFFSVTVILLSAGPHTRLWDL